MTRLFVYVLSAVSLLSAAVPAQRITSHIPALPRYYVNTHPSAMPSHGTVRVVHNGGDLQAAINAASPGDKIDIDPGATLFGVYTLPAKVGADSLHWITIETAGVSTTEGVRLDTAQARTLNLAKLVTSDSSGSGLGLFSTVGAASYYRFTNLELRQPVHVSFTYRLVVADTGSKHIAFDHVYAHGDSAHTLLAAFTFNGAWLSITDSWCDQIHDGEPDGILHGNQAQCVTGWTGPGPYKIVNNYLSASGENVLFGGASQSRWINQNPADIEIRRNHFFKPLWWMGLHNVCNLLECKNCQRMLVEANLFENNWISEQNGTAILFQTADQYGIQPWTQVSDITFRYNWITNANPGLQMSGHVRDYNSLGYVVPVNTSTSRIVIENNVFDKIGVDPFTQGNSAPLLSINEGTVDVKIRHNTFVAKDSTVIDGFMQDAQGGVNVGFALNDNILDMGTYGLGCAQGSFDNCNSTVTSVPGLHWQMTGNIFTYWSPHLPNTSWGSTASYPAGNQFMNITSMPFTSFVARNYLLTVDYRSTTTDHKQVGANIATLNAMLAGVP